MALQGTPGAWVAPGAVNLIGRLPTRPGAAPYPDGALGAIDLLVAHYLGDRAEAPTVEGLGDPTPEDVARFHSGPTAQERFPAIAYTWVIRRDGTLYQCHRVETITWHVAGHNRRARGVLLTGFGRLGCPSAVQLATLALLWRALTAHLGRPLALTGHRLVVANSACPGDLAEDWLAEVRVLAERVHDVGEEAMSSETMTRQIGDYAVAHAFLRAWEQLDGAPGRPLGPLVYSGDRALQAFERCTMVWTGRLSLLDLEL